MDGGSFAGILSKSKSSSESREFERERGTGVFLATSGLIIRPGGTVRVRCAELTGMRDICLGAGIAGVVRLRRWRGELRVAILVTGIRGEREAGKRRGNRERRGIQSGEIVKSCAEEQVNVKWA